MYNTLYFFFYLIGIILLMFTIGLEFSIDKNSGEITVRIIQNKSDRIIREIPGRELLNSIGTIDETV